MKFKLTKDIPEIGISGEVVELSDEQYQTLPFNSSLESVKEDKKKSKKNIEGDI